MALSMKMAAAIAMSLRISAVMGDCGWTSTCGPRGCPDCKDDGSAGYRECCGGSPSPGPTPPPTPTPPPGPTPPPTPTPPPGPPGAKPVEIHGGLMKKGNRIVDKHGNNVKLNGMSMFWSNWAGSFWNADVVKYLASDWKISLIRCPMGVSNDAGPVSGGYLSDPQGQTKLMETVVDAAIEAGIYAIIDWHVEGKCDASQSKPFFEHFAKKYGDKENVMFETCNEPHGWGWNDGLKAYHEQVVPVIRQFSSNLIIAGTNTWSQDVDEASKSQLADHNVAYTLHFYSSMHKQNNRDKASVGMQNGAAIFVTEWGVEQHNEGNAETETWLQFLRDNSISNSNWGVYDKSSEAWAIIKQGKSPTGGWSDSDLTASGHFLRDYLQKEAGVMDKEIVSTKHFAQQPSGYQAKMFRNVFAFALAGTASGNNSFVDILESFDFEPTNATNGGGAAVLTYYKDSGDCSGASTTRKFDGCMRFIDARTGKPAARGSITATCAEGGKKVDNVIFPDSTDCSGVKQAQSPLPTDMCLPQGGEKPTFKWSCSTAEPNGLEKNSSIVV